MTILAIFAKNHETTGVFYRHICSSSFAQDGKVNTHSALDCKQNWAKQRIIGQYSSVTAGLWPGSNSTSKLYSSFPCRYVYNTSVKNSVVCNEYEAQKSVWKTWFSNSNACKPVHPIISYADVIKNNVLKSNIQQIAPLVAVQERSHQRKPPLLVKEVADNTHKAHLRNGKECRFVDKPFVSYSSVSVPCFNSFDHLSDCDFVL